MKRKFGGLVLTISLMLGLTNVAIADATSEIVTPEIAVTKFYDAALNFDVQTYLKYSKNLVFDSKQEQKEQIEMLFSDTENSTKMVDYKIEKMTKISNEEYIATVNQVYDTIGQIPAYDVPVIKEAGIWVVVLENITFEKKTEAKDLSSINSGAGEVIAEDDNFNVVKYNTGKDIFELLPDSKTDTVAPMATVFYY